MLKTNYRADIDGLRALAVMSVFLFHLNSSWVPNGFLGVDIFFVISGFLITTIIYKGVTTNTFSFAEFYKRRIKRILPAFYLILIVGLAFGYLFMLPELAMEVGRSARASLFFLANILFARQVGYFEGAAEEKPFLHIWSLSVEEQFYFVFPIFLLLLFKSPFLWKHRIKVLVGLFLFLSLSSFIDLQKFGITWEVYYLPHLRFIELLIGSFLAIALYDKRVILSNRGGVNKFLSLVSLFVLIFSLFDTHIINFSQPFFPGISAIIPCTAVAVLLFANQDNHIVSRAFSNPLVVWVGKISYSLYLWHWLILAFVHYFWGEGELSPQLILVVLVLSFVFASLSYYLVEQPIRKSNLSFKQSFTFIYILPTVLFLIWINYKTDKETYQQIEEKYYSFDKSFGYNSIEGDCRRGDLSKATTVLVAGDSHTGHIFRFIDIIGKKEGWCAFVTAAASNPFFFDYTFSFPRGQIEGFSEYRNNYLEQEYLKYDDIVLANYWGSRYYKKDEQFIPHLKQTIEKLLKANKRVYLINTLYNVQGATLPQRFQYLRINGYELPNILRQSNKSYGEFHQPYRETAMNIKKIITQAFPQVKWVDIQVYQEKFLKTSESFMQDTDHLNDYGAELFAREFINDKRKLIETN